MRSRFMVVLAVAALGAAALACGGPGEEIGGGGGEPAEQVSVPVEEASESTETAESLAESLEVALTFAAGRGELSWVEFCSGSSAAVPEWFSSSYADGSDEFGPTIQGVPVEEVWAALFARVC